VMGDGLAMLVCRAAMYTSRSFPVIDLLELEV
jgi:hypothetical protein